MTRSPFTIVARSAARVGLAIATVAVSLGALPGRAAADAGAPTPVTEALAGALQIAGGRLEVVSWRTTAATPAQACAPETASVMRPINASGRYAVKLAGPGCEGWGWAQVRVYSSGFVTTKVVHVGEPLSGAVRAVEQEVRGARVPASVGEGAKAARNISAGQMIEAAHIDTGRPTSGATIKVMIRSGSLTVSQSGRAVPCSAGRICAVLPSGKHVEGTMNDDTLVVEIP